MVEDDPAHNAPRPGERRHIVRMESHTVYFYSREQAGRRIVTRTMYAWTDDNRWIGEDWYDCWWHYFVSKNATVSD